MRAIRFVAVLAPVVAVADDVDAIAGHRVGVCR